MKRIFASLLVASGIALAGVAPAQAACSVEYKAKRDNPLELFYNTATIAEPCTEASARAQLAPMLAAQGLTLLKIVSVRKG